jgi:hypothetical protein
LPSLDGHNQMRPQEARQLLWQVLATRRCRRHEAAQRTKSCHLGASGVGSGEPGRRQERTDSTGAKIKISTNVKIIRE